MNRRGFLGWAIASVAGIAAVAALPATAATATTDDFTHNGYRVKWGGWTQPANQNVRVGAWHAKHGTKDLQWVSTALGQCYPSRDWEVYDMSLARGWPMLTGFSTDAELSAAKQRALGALMEQLK